MARAGSSATRPLHKWPLLKSAAEIGGEEKRKEGKERVKGRGSVGRGGST